MEYQWFSEASSFRVNDEQQSILQLAAGQEVAFGNVTARWSSCTAYLYCLEAAIAEINHHLNAAQVFLVKICLVW